MQITQGFIWTQVVMMIKNGHSSSTSLQTGHKTFMVKRLSLRGTAMIRRLLLKLDRDMAGLLFSKVFCYGKLYFHPSQILLRYAQERKDVFLT